MNRRCGYCKGRKRVKKSQYDMATIGCPICKAMGTVDVPEEYTICGHCDGTGMVNSGYANAQTSACEVCQGKGWAKPS